MTMQWILLLIGYIMLVAAAAARKAHDEVYASYSYPSYHRNLETRFISLDGMSDFSPLGDPLNAELEEGESKTVSKRALSVLSRWRPFGNLGVRMNSIHKTPSKGTLKMSLSPGVDFVSAETRGSTRPLGQPLRWGRKR